MRLSRRQFLGATLGGGAIGVAGASYARWIEPGWFEVTHTAVKTGRGVGRDKVRVLHLSDLHASEVVPLPMIARAFALGLAERPDLVLLTGDFWTDRYHDFTRYGDVLRQLSAAAPTYAVVGNHDGGRWAGRTTGWPTLAPISRLLAEARIPLLFNESTALDVRGRPVELFGVGDLWAGDCHAPQAFAGHESRAAGERTLRLVLNHNPDAKDEFRNLDWDVMCCGHTHGGQVKLPFLGTPFAPVQDLRYVAGLNDWEGHQIFTTRGVGNLHGVRFNCRPEISVLELS